MLLTIDQASSDELDDVLGILDEAAAWLRDQGITQWPARFTGAGDWRTSRIEHYVSSGQTWLVRAGGVPVATFSLTDTADPDYAEGWPDGPDSALYIFRMAVRREWAGHDLGAKVLDWASARALAAGQTWLRLDCHRHNRRLQLYYEHRGFVRVATLVKTICDNGEPYTRGSGALYQRPAGAVHLPDLEATVTDRYDPTGEAAIWDRAAQLVAKMALDTGPEDRWNVALSQASRALENEARAVRQGTGGMYYRVITGEDYTPQP
jgi:ribosomal protein S18 acetylase RimI-like enzyme